MGNGYNLYAIRTKAGYSQEDVAAYLGTTQAQYSKYERGVQDLSAKRVVLLCDLFKCTADELLGRIECEKEVE